MCPQTRFRSRRSLELVSVDDFYIHFAPDGAFGNGQNPGRLTLRIGPLALVTNNVLSS